MVMHTFNPSTRTAWSVHSEFLASQGSLVTPNCLLTAYTMDPELGFSDSLNGCWFNYLVNLGSCHSLTALCWSRSSGPRVPGICSQLLSLSSKQQRCTSLPGVCLHPARDCA